MGHEYSLADPLIHVPLVLWGPAAFPRGVVRDGLVQVHDLFATVLDLAGVPATEMRRLPQASFVRLQRLVEDGTTALLLVASRHTATSPRGVTLAMRRIAPWWSGQPGPGRLFRGLRCEATAGRHAQQQAAFDLHAL